MRAFLTNDDSLSVTCGSLTATVITGPVEFSVGDVDVTVPSDTTFTITQNADGSVSVENDESSTGTIIVSVGAEETTVGPGETLAATPRGIKELTLERLRLHADESKEIEKAIKSLDKSLEAKLWLDDSHLDLKNGDKVLKEERKAVKELEKALKEKGKDDLSEEAREWVELAIDDLAAADRLLETIFIDEVAGEEALDSKRQDKVDKELAKGDEERADGDAEKAIEHYGKAWEHAEKALKEQTKASKGGKDDDEDEDGDDEDEDGDEEEEDEDDGGDEDGNGKKSGKKNDD